MGLYQLTDCAYVLGYWTQSECFLNYPIEKQTAIVALFEKYTAMVSKKLTKKFTPNDSVSSLKVSQDRTSLSRSLERILLHTPTPEKGRSLGRLAFVALTLRKALKEKLGHDKKPNYDNVGKPHDAFIQARDFILGNFAKTDKIIAKYRKRGVWAEPSKPSGCCVAF